MRKEVSMLLCFALCLLFASSLCAAAADLATADWSVNSPHNLSNNPPSDDAIVELLNRLTSPSAPAYFGICSSRFADLRHSGNLSLVVSASDGRHCSLSIIDKTLSGFEVYGFNQDAEVEAIEDLAGNGNLELVLNTSPPGDFGLKGPCIPTWPAIFAWTGSGYTDVSSQYKSYYERELASLKEKIVAAEEPQTPAAALTPASQPHMLEITQGQTVAGDRSPSASGESGSEPLAIAPQTSPSPAASPAVGPAEVYVPDCTEAEAAKIEHFLGISQDAEMSDAIRWANSENPERRVLASLVLLDIGNPEANEYLRTLSHDSNERVAEIAKIQLGFVERGPALPKFERQEVEPLAESPPK